MNSISTKPGAFYRFGYADPRAIYTSNVNKSWIVNRPYGYEFNHKRKWASPLMPNKKVDAHKYKTEAKDLPIEACQNMWLIKYGNEPIKAVDTVDQEILS